MIRIHILQSRAPGVGRSQRIRVVWCDAQELTVSGEEVRRTALALLRAADRSDVRARLTLAGLSGEQISRALGAAVEGAEGEFQVSLGRRPGTIRFARGDARVLIACADARMMGHDWLRVAESADSDNRLVRALEHATTLTADQIDDVFAYLRILRSRDPATEITDN